MDMTEEEMIKAYMKIPLGNASHIALQNAVIVILLKEHLARKEKDADKPVHLIREDKKYNTASGIVTVDILNEILDTLQKDIKEGFKKANSFESIEESMYDSFKKAQDTIEVNIIEYGS